MIVMNCTNFPTVHNKAKKFCRRRHINVTAESGIPSSSVQFFTAGHLIFPARRNIFSNFSWIIIHQQSLGHGISVFFLCTHMIKMFLGYFEASLPEGVNIIIFSEPAVIPGGHHELRSR